MNIRTASLLTALLFLAAPLALVPTASAQVPELPPDCTPLTDPTSAVNCVAVPPGLADIVTCLQATPGPECLVGPIEPECPAPSTGEFPNCQVDGVPPEQVAVLIAQLQQCVASQGADCPLSPGGAIVIPSPLGGDPIGGDDGCGIDGEAPDVSPNPPCPVDFVIITLETDASDLPVVHVHFVEPQALPDSLFSDGVDTVQDLYVQSALDLDNDGDADTLELFSCVSNPFNPLANCQDADGDGLQFYTTSDLSATECDEVGGSFDAEAEECTVDEETDCAGHDPGLACDPNNWNTDGGDATNCPDNNSDSQDTYPTDCTDDDKDGDGLKSAAEATCGTNPNVKDTDGDGLHDGIECGTQTKDTDPLDADTDDDTFTDGQEVNGMSGFTKSDPTDADSVPQPSGAPDGCFNSDVCFGAVVCDGNGIGPATIPAGTLPGGCITTTLPEGLRVLTGKPANCDPTDSSSLFGLTSPYADFVFEVLDFLPAPIGVGGPAPNPGTVQQCAPSGAPAIGPELLCALNSDPEVEPVFPDCLLALVPSDVPLPGTPFDLQDPWDIDGDGKRNEPNNQPDLLEQRILYLDQDEAADSSREKNDDLEGETGATLVVLNPTGALVGTPANLVRVHAGDVASTTVQDLAVVDLTGTPAGGFVCIFIVDNQPVVALGDEFDDAAPEPCADRVLWDVANAQLAAAGITVLDANGDSIPEALIVAVPDPENCDPMGDCAFMDVTIPLGGLPTLPVDPVSAICANDPAGLPVCPSEPNPCEENPELPECQPGECDPTADPTCADPTTLPAEILAAVCEQVPDLPVCGDFPPAFPPEGCDVETDPTTCVPAGPVDPAAVVEALCAADATGVLGMAGLCGPGEPNPCEENPELPECQPGECDPTADPTCADPTTLPAEILAAVCEQVPDLPVCGDFPPAFPPEGCDVETDPTTCVPVSPPSPEPGTCDGAVDFVCFDEEPGILGFLGLGFGVQVNVPGVIHVHL